MTTKTFALTYLLGILYLIPVWGFGQSTRSDSEMIGSAVVANTCPLTPQEWTKDDGNAVRTESALGLAGSSFLGGMTGDIVTAGLNSLGAALEEASREKGFSVLGSTSFTYYQIEKPDPGIFKPVSLSSALTTGASRCLILSFVGTNKKAVSFDTGTLKELELNVERAEEWPNYGLPVNPDVYIEAELQTRQDGFVVRPVLIWYRSALSGAPKRDLPAELHLSFSIPATPVAENGLGTVFALARIRLPSISPGALLVANDLKPFSSPVLLARATTGSPEALRQELTAAIANFEANTKRVKTLEKSLRRATKAASAKGATKEEKASAVAFQDQLMETQSETYQLKFLSDKASAANYPLPAGSTNVQVRFTIVRNANQFGLAVAKSLQTRSKALGESVSKQLTPGTKASAWTAADTSYVLAMTAVENAQHTLDNAIAKGDADTIFLAQTALKNVKAAANAAAAASDRSIPYPNLI